MNARQTITVLAAAWLAATAAAATAAVPREGAAADGRLAAGLAAKQSSFTLGEPTVVTFTLRNVSGDTFSVWSRSAPWGYENYAVEVTLPNGETVTATEILPAVLPGGPERKGLSPGESLAADLDLSRMSAGPLPAGVFTVRGVYHVGSDERNADPAVWRERLRGMWTGTLRTQPVQFAIEPNAFARDLRPGDPPRVVWVDDGVDKPVLLAYGTRRQPAPGDVLVPARPADAAAPAGRTGRAGAMEPVARLRVEKLYPGMCLAQPVAGHVFDRLMLGDRCEEAIPAKRFAEELDPAGFGLLDDGGAPRTVCFSYQGMPFRAAVNPDAAQRSALLRVERLRSRGEADRTCAIWSSPYNSLLESLRFDGTNLVVSSQFRAWTVGPLSGRIVRTDESGAGANPAQDAPAAGGLQLSLRADTTETYLRRDGSGAEPVGWRLIFGNVGTQPIKLDMYDWAESRVSLRVTGPDGESVYVKAFDKAREMAPPAATDFPKLDPTVSVLWPFKFPGQFGWKEFVFRKAGKYAVRATYALAAPRDVEPASGCWTGTVTSAEVVLAVGSAPPGMPPPAQTAGGPPGRRARDAE